MKKYYIVETSCSPYDQSFIKYEYLKHFEIMKEDFYYLENMFKIFEITSSFIEKNLNEIKREEKHQIENIRNSEEVSNKLKLNIEKIFRPGRGCLLGDGLYNRTFLYVKDFLNNYEKSVTKIFNTGLEREIIISTKFVKDSKTFYGFPCKINVNFNMIFMFKTSKPDIFNDKLFNFYSKGVSGTGRGIGSIREDILEKRFKDIRILRLYTSGEWVL